MKQVSIQEFLKGLFFITNEFSDSQQKLLGVSEGDTIVAEYKDETIPSATSPYDNIDVTGTSKFTINLTLDQTFGFANTSIVDSEGVKITSVDRNQTFWIMSEIINHSNHEQFFVFSVAIEDEKGQIIDKKEEIGNLSPSQSYSPALSFSISKTGNYIAKAFLSNDAKDSSLFFSEVHLKIEKTPYDLLDDEKFMEKQDKRIASEIVNELSTFLQNENVNPDQLVKSINVAITKLSKKDLGFAELLILLLIEKYQSLHKQHPFQIKK